MSKYNPDSQFSKEALERLEEVGIKILTSLDRGDNFTQLEEATGITLTEKQKRPWDSEEPCSI